MDVSDTVFVNVDVSETVFVRSEVAEIVLVSVDFSVIVSTAIYGIHDLKPNVVVIVEIAVMSLLSTPPR
ncbi:MAG: hypothetical protein ACYTFI_00790 [Planctomycetota bacterium]